MLGRLSSIWVIQCTLRSYDLEEAITRTVFSQFQPKLVIRGVGILAISITIIYFLFGHLSN